MGLRIDEPEAVSGCTAIQMVGGSPEAGADEVDLDLEFAELASLEGGAILFSATADEQPNFVGTAAGHGHHLDTSVQKQKGPQTAEARKSLYLFGAEAGTRTPMSVPSLRPERWHPIHELRATVDFSRVRSMPGFAGIACNKNRRVGSGILTGILKEERVCFRKKRGFGRAVWLLS